MKKLFLIRHTQALHAENVTDKERKLSPDGEAESKALGRAMKVRHYQPDFILCSPATRTISTLDGLMETIEPARADYPTKLYNASRGDLLHFIQNIDDKVNNLMIVGHNPGIYELATALVLEDPETPLNRLTADYKPGTLSVFECNIESWATIQPATNKLIDLLEPLDYNAPSTPARWT